MFALLRCQLKPNTLMVISLSRFVLVPLLLLCVAPSPTYPILPSPFWVSIVLVSIVGLSTGYFGTVPMVLAPTLVPHNLRELTGEEFIHPSVHLSIVHSFFHQSFKLSSSINPSSHLSIHLFIYSFIFPAIRQFSHLYIHSYVYLYSHIHLSLYPSIKRLIIITSSGTMMVFSLLSGLTAGAVFATAWTPLTEIATYNPCTNITAEFFCKNTSMLITD